MSPAHLIPVFGLARELELVGRFCEQTEVNKESHATLLMGPHNTGKSLVLNTVLRDLEARTGNKPVVIVLDGYLHADEAAALVVIGDVLGMQAELAQQHQRQTQAEQQQQLQQEQEQEDKQEEQEHERQQESAARASAAEEISAITELTFHSTVLAMLNCWKQVNPGRELRRWRWGLLVAMKLFEEDKIEEYNFEMVYDRFQKFARDEFMSVTKPTAFAAFESLLEQELIKKVARRAEEKATPKGFLMVRLMPIPAQIEDVLRDPACMLPQSVVTWGTKWVS
ncbi:uncharacterized protein ACA1_355240 [Acanthamoeba castellanii str. Neff]|uniref:Origin recognition complex subunit 4 C-terminal domain-containing protein n=1 Tax=Acanthamoeba castellanii (strain ATCC 30010 / Neff) TaxID=1257118 RepID=L8H7V2_ACACF|nr:uncharacterized protein ACA1_355240 [Acanthamoeba castellanii str. Neff]ELR21220.1 hypothetical protein ACA1_355240 [Acanthamoeba castellanii str. Neff]